MDVFCCFYIINYFSCNVFDIHTHLHTKQILLTVSLLSAIQDDGMMYSCPQEQPFSSSRTCIVAEISSVVLFEGPTTFFFFFFLCDFFVLF